MVSIEDSTLSAINDEFTAGISSIREENHILKYTALIQYLKKRYIGKHGIEKLAEEIYQRVYLETSFCEDFDNLPALILELHLSNHDLHQINEGMNLYFHSFK